MHVAVETIIFFLGDTDVTLFGKNIFISQSIFKYSAAATCPYDSLIFRYGVQ